MYMTKKGGTQFKYQNGKTHYEENRAYYYGKTKERRRVMKEKLREYKSKLQCVDCHNDNPIVIEFDHIRTGKVCSVSAMISRGFSWENIQKEIEKCEPVCSNCHAIRTHERRVVHSGVSMV